MIEWTAREIGGEMVFDLTEEFGEVMFNAGGGQVAREA